MYNQNDEDLKQVRRKAFWTWFGLSVFTAGFLYLVIECIIHKSFFYVLNKEAYNGYFYAWSITLVSGLLTTMCVNWKKPTICEKKGRKIIYTIIASVIIVLLLGFYVWYSQKENTEVESLVKSLRLEMPEKNGCRDYFTIDKSKVDKMIDSIIISINTDEFVERIDKEKLKETLVRYNYEIVNPIPHRNGRMIIITLLSFAISWLILSFIYPKHKKEKKRAPNK